MYNDKSNTFTGFWNDMEANYRGIENGVHEIMELCQGGQGGEPELLARLDQIRMEAEKIRAHNWSWALLAGFEKVRAENVGRA